MTNKPTNSQALKAIHTLADLFSSKATELETYGVLDSTVHDTREYLTTLLLTASEDAARGDLTGSAADAHTAGHVTTALAQAISGYVGLDDVRPEHDRDGDDYQASLDDAVNDALSAEL